MLTPTPPHTLLLTEDKTHTSNYDGGTSLGLCSWVCALTVVSSSMISFDIADAVRFFQFPGGLGIKETFFLTVPGKVNGKTTSLNRADKSHVVTLRDVLHPGLSGQVWF